MMLEAARAKPRYSDSLITWRSIARFAARRTRRSAHGDFGSHCSVNTYQRCDEEVVAVAELLGLHRVLQVRLVDLPHRRKLVHLEGAEGVEEPELELVAHRGTSAPRYSVDSRPVKEIGRIPMP